MFFIAEIITVLSLYSFSKNICERVYSEGIQRRCILFQQFPVDDHLLDVQQTFETIDWPVKYGMKQMLIDEVDADSTRFLAFTFTLTNKKNLRNND